MRVDFLKKQIHFSSHMGRMGNQMFQYACAKNLELSYGFSCSLDDLSQLRYFKLGKDELIVNKWKEKKFFLTKKFFGADIHDLKFDDLHQDYSEWLQNINKPSMVWGFFQSEKYFKENKLAIKEFFEIKEEYKTSFERFLQHNNLKSGAYNAVHIRRTDYKGFEVKGLEGNDFVLPIDYYRKTISFFDNSIPTLFISDDSEFCKQEFKDLSNTIFSQEDSITDFQLLSNAKNIIISNSTFAWWAAWLNPYNGCIYSPKYFLGFKEKKEVPINICPANFKQIL